MRETDATDRLTRLLDDLRWLHTRSGPSGRWWFTREYTAHKLRGDYLRGKNDLGDELGKLIGEYTDWAGYDDPGKAAAAFQYSDRSSVYEWPDSDEDEWGDSDDDEDDPVPSGTATSPHRRHARSDVIELDAQLALGGITELSKATE